MTINTEEIACNIERFYEYATDGDPEGAQRAHNIFGGILEDLCDPDEFDLEAIFMPMGMVGDRKPRALAWFAAQAVVELHSLGWDAETAYARWDAERAEAERVRKILEEEDD